jgi:hypothetical protein
MFRFMFSLAVVLLAHVAPLIAAEKSTCALIVSTEQRLHESPLATLLEAKLLAANLSLVERQEITKVLSEQQLATLQSAAGVGERVKLGKLLKADWLVMLSSIPKTANMAQLVVCEASSGVRVLVNKVALDQKPEPLAKELTTSITQAIQRKTESLELCAIPPFISKDLIFDHDAMKGAYAALTEQAVLQAGLVTVELAEAEALERELLLDAKNGQKLVRSLPLFLLGEYRHEGINENLRVTLTLTLKRGERELSKRTRKNIEPNRAAGVIHEVSLELLNSLDKKPPRTALDPMLEVKELLSRIRAFERVGDWRETLELFEACLLLDPKNIIVRQELIEMMSKLNQTFDARVDDFYVYHQRVRRSINHMDYVLRHTKFVPQKHLPYFFRTDAHIDPKETDPQRIQAVRETQLMKVNFITGIVRHRLTTKQDDRLIHHLCVESALPWQVIGESKRQAFERLYNFLCEFEQHPQVEDWAYSFSSCFICFNSAYTDENGKLARSELAPGVEEFINRLIQSKSEGLKKTGLKLQAQRQALIEAGLAITLPTPFPVVPPKQATKGPGPIARFEPIKVDYGTCLEHLEVSRILMIEPKLDVLTLGVGGSIGMAVLKEPGKQKIIWTSRQSKHEGDFYGIEAQCYDGKYVWATVKDEKGWLLVVDPHTEQAWEFDHTQGLLPHNSMVQLAALEPGKVCMIGGFHKPDGVGRDTGRGWVANVSFKPETGIAVKVFHEAKEVLKEDTKLKITPATVAFTPEYAFVLGRGAEQRVLVGRIVEHNAWECAAPPLIIDPWNQTVKLWQADPKLRLPGKGKGPWNSIAVVHQNALYFAESEHSDDRIYQSGWKPALFRATLPDFKVEKISQLPPVTFPKETHFDQGITAIAVDNGKLFFASLEQLYYYDLKSGKCDVLRHTYPDGTTGCDNFVQSGHFGFYTGRYLNSDSIPEFKGKYSEGDFRISLPK